MHRQRTRPSRRSRFIAAALFPLIACGCAAQPDTRLETLLALNAEARGGRAAFENLRAMRLEVEIREPEFSVTVFYRATREGLVRVDVEADGQRVFTEALGPTGGWQLRRDQEAPAPLSPGGDAVLRRGMISNLHALYQWPRHGYRLRLEPGSADRPFDVVLAEDSAGFMRRLWIDRQSHLVIREYERSALHPDIDRRESEQYSQVEEWLEARGLRIPRVIRKFEIATGEEIQHSTVTGAELVMTGDSPPAWMDRQAFLPPDAPNGQPVTVSPTQRDAP